MTPRTGFHGGVTVPGLGEYSPAVAVAPVHPASEKILPRLPAIGLGAYFLATAALSRADERLSWIPQVAGLAVGLVWLATAAVDREHGLIWSKPVILYLCWVLWTLTGAAVTPYPEWFFGVWGTAAKVAVITFIASQCVRTRADLLGCLLFVGIAAVVIFVTGRESIMRAAAFRGSVEEEGSRAAGTLISNQNELGHFGVLVLLASLVCCIGFRSWFLRLVALAPVPVALYIIAASGSRLAMVSIVVGGMASYWFHFRKAGAGKITRTIMMVGLGLGIVAGGVYFVVKSPFFFRLVNVFSSTDAAQDEPRFIYFVKAMKATAEHPFLGLGLEGFAMNRLGGTVSKGGHYSHSDISETLSCTGIPGFLLYYGTYLAFFNRLRRLRRSALPPQDMAMVNMIMAFLVVVLTAGVVGVFTTHRLQWPLIGAMCGYLGYLQSRYGSAAGPAASTPAYGRGTA